VVDLGAGASPNEAWTCVTAGGAGEARRPSPVPGLGADSGPLERTRPRHFPIEGPEWGLRPVPAEAERLDRRWRETGEPLDVLVPVSCTGLKTRFDELLVDDVAERLVARVDAFLRTRDLEEFARAQRIPGPLLPKLEALRRTPGLPSRADPGAVRPFHRWAGARHRGGLPASSRAFCYLDRRLIPRGDHRLVGAFDPHAGDCKLVFNLRELPLAATLLESEGCIPAHRHTRFAPLHVPERVRSEGPAAGRSGGSLGPPVPNLSPAGLAWAERVGAPREAFRRIAAFINSGEVQEVWAPAFGCSRVLPVRCATDEHPGDSPCERPPPRVSLGRTSSGGRAR
jgi:hypothetical protein